MLCQLIRFCTSDDFQVVCKLENGFLHPVSFRKKHLHVKEKKVLFQAARHQLFTKKFKRKWYYGYCRLPGTIPKAISDIAFKRLNISLTCTCNIDQEWWRNYWKLSLGAKSYIVHISTQFCASKVASTKGFAQKQSLNN